MRSASSKKMYAQVAPLLSHFMIARTTGSLMMHKPVADRIHSTGNENLPSHQISHLIADDAQARR